MWTVQRVRRSWWRKQPGKRRCQDFRQHTRVVMDLRQDLKPSDTTTPLDKTDDHQRRRTPDRWSRWHRRATSRVFRTGSLQFMSFSKHLTPVIARSTCDEAIHYERWIASSLAMTIDRHLHDVFVGMADASKDTDTRVRDRSVGSATAVPRPWKLACPTPCHGLSVGFPAGRSMTLTIGHLSQCFRKIGRAAWNPAPGPPVAMMRARWRRIGRTVG